jgi:TetR/AcrR family transcriptional repressor of nem operon
MRVSRQEMEASHQRIVEGASRLIRERGIAGVSVADAMEAAGLTHGGFYRHFDGKEALVAEALRAAFDEFLGPLEARRGGPEAARAGDQFAAMYLSDEHVAHAGRGCPMPALAAELARGGAALKADFGAGVQRALRGLAVPGRGDERRQQRAAARRLAMLVGAMTLARASDPDTARLLLESCREE